MTGYEIYVFFLCLIVFTALTTLFTIFTVWIVKLLVRIIRAGLEDEKIKKEYLKQQRLGKKVKTSEIFDKIISGLFGVLFLVVFVFSVGMSITAEKMVGDIPVARVVQSGSMSKKYEKNTYLFDNDLNDQIQTFDIIVTEKLPDEKDLKLYDIVVYEVDDVLVVHRIIKIEEANDKHPDCRWFTLQGDNVQYPDKTPVLYSQMRGIYKGTRIPYVGSFISFMQSPAGYLCILLLVFGSIAIPLVEKILERERLKRLKFIFEKPKKTVKAVAEPKPIEIKIIPPTDKEIPNPEPEPKEAVEKDVPVEPKPIEAKAQAQQPKQQSAQLPLKPVTEVKPLQPRLDEESFKKLYDGVFVRNTYDWFYDSLTERERYEFIDSFVLKELGRSQYLPNYIIRGENYAFFRVFFENVELFKDKLSPTLLEKMRQYCINMYKTTF